MDDLTPFHKFLRLWHPAVMTSQLPKTPSPFSIDDILNKNNNKGGYSTLMPELTSALARHMTASHFVSQAFQLQQQQANPDKPKDSEQPLNLSTKHPTVTDHDSKKRKREKDESSSDKRKKIRTTFTGRQIFELEKMFETKKYLSSAERTELADMLNVTEQQVKIWFQNRRTKWKKQENISNAEAASFMKGRNKSKDDDQSSSSPPPTPATPPALEEPPLLSVTPTRVTPPAPTSPAPDSDSGDERLIIADESKADMKAEN